MEFLLRLAHSWSSGPLDSVCGYFPVPKCIMGVDRRRSCQKPCCDPSCFTQCGIEYLCRVWTGAHGQDLLRTMMSPKNIYRAWGLWDLCDFTGCTLSPRRATTVGSAGRTGFVFVLCSWLLGICDFDFLCQVHIDASCEGARGISSYTVCPGSFLGYEREPRTGQSSPA